MKILNVKQGSDEWHKARRGRVSGIKLKNIMGTKQKFYEQIAEFIAEERTEKSKIFRATAEMERGITEEPFAVKRFEEVTGKKVTEVGICVSDTNPLWINSPDGLIGETEAIEIKSMDSHNQVFHEILNAFEDINKEIPAGKRHKIGVPTDYEWQVIHYFLVNEKLETLYFLYWDSRVIDEEKQLEIVEVKRENEIVKDMIDRAILKLEEFETELNRVRNILSKSSF